MTDTYKSLTYDEFVTKMIRWYSDYCRLQGENAGLREGAERLKAQVVRLEAENMRLLAEYERLRDGEQEQDE